MVQRERLILGHCLILSIMVVRAGIIIFHGGYICNPVVIMVLIEITTLCYHFFFCACNIFHNIFSN